MTEALAPQTYTQLRLDLAAALASFLDPLEASAETQRWFEEGLGKDRSWMVAHGEDPVPEDTRRRVSQWVRERKTGLPWAYILGWTRFRGRHFLVTRDTLIPRPETELVVEAALDVGHRLKVRRVCDVGTGSGIIGVTLALEALDWEVTASDLSEGALHVARANAAALGAPVAFVQGDLLRPVSDPVGLVVSNPPYIDPDDEPTLQKELAFEPRTALFAQDRGLALSTELLRQTRLRFSPGAILEIGAGQGAELKARAEGMGYGKVMVHQDFHGHDRVLIALA